MTFIACLAFLQQIGQPYEGFVPALVALLEVPGIVVALLLPGAAATPTGERRSGSC